VNARLAANNLLNRFYFNHMSAYRQLLLPEQGRNVSFALQIPFEIIQQNKNK
jgi:iron complex outermembrane receptor protein